LFLKFMLGSTSASQELIICGADNFVCYLPGAAPGECCLHRRSGFPTASGQAMTDENAQLLATTNDCNASETGYLDFERLMWRADT